MPAENGQGGMTVNETYRIPFEIPPFPEQEFGSKIFEVKDFVVEGEEKQTIQRTINACVDAGGGTVFVNEGEWFSGTIRLFSNICLLLEEGAVIRFSQEYADYLPVVFTRWEGMECYNYSPLIYARDCENIKVAGNGRLIGGGEAWWHWKKLQGEAARELCYAESDKVPVEKRVYGTEQAALRPSFVQFVNCRNVSLEDFTIEEGPQWTLHPVYCENIRVRKVNVRTSGPNTDGLNPDSCKNVWIEKCTFSTGDDCIAINSGMNEDGWRVGKPCENIVIVDCDMNGGHGALVIGSGMSGGVRNVYAANCRIAGTNQGIRLKSMRGRGGYVRDVWFEDIRIDDAAQEAVQISMYYPYSTVEPRGKVPSDFSHIHLKNITGNSEQTAVEIRGLPEKKLKKLELSDISLSAPRPLVCDDTEEISMNNVMLSFLT